ncbi:hypothetical protein ABPG72_002232 [Tetrahymena utriculariae]
MNKYPSVEIANFLSTQNNPSDSQRDKGDKGIKKQKMLLSESLKNIQLQNENLEVDISDQKMMYTRQIREMDQESLSIKSQIDYINLQINQQQILKKELQFKILSCKDKIEEYQKSLQEKSNMQKQLTRSLSNGIKSTVKENENLKQILLEKQQNLGSMENDLIEVQQKIQELQSEVELLISTSGLKSQMIQHCRQELQTNFQKMEQSKMEINSLRDLLASCEMEHKSVQSQVQECKQQKNEEQELLQKQLSQIKIDQEQVQREKKAEQKKMVFIHKQSAIRVIFNSVNKIKRRFYLEFLLKLQSNEQKSLLIRQNLRRVLVIQNKLSNKVMQFYLRQWRSKINLKQEESRNLSILKNIFDFKVKAKFYKTWRKCFEHRQFQLYRKYQALSNLNIIDKTINKIVVQRAFSKWLVQIKKIYKFIFCLERVNRNIQNKLVRQGFTSIQQECKKQLQDNLFEENINFVVQQRIQFQCFQEWKNFSLLKKRKNIIILGRSLKLWKLFIYQKKMRQLQIFHISVNLKKQEENFLKKIINSWNFTIQNEKIQKLRQKQQQLSSQQENVSSSLKETEEELLNTQKRHALSLVINRQSSQLKLVIHLWRIASINIKNLGNAFYSILNGIVTKQKLQALIAIKKQNEKQIKCMESITITQFYESIQETEQNIQKHQDSILLHKNQQKIRNLLQIIIKKERKLNEIRMIFFSRFKAAARKISFKKTYFSRLFGIIQKKSLFYGFKKLFQHYLHDKSQSQNEKLIEKQLLKQQKKLVKQAMESFKNNVLQNMQVRLFLRKRIVKIERQQIIINFFKWANILKVEQYQNYEKLIDQQNEQTENLKEDIEQLQMKQEVTKNLIKQKDNYYKNNIIRFLHKYIMLQYKLKQKRALNLWKTNLKHNDNLVKLSSVLDKYFKVQLQRVYFNYIKQHCFKSDIYQYQQKIQDLEKNFNEFKRKHDTKVKEISEQLINLDQIQQSQNEKKLEIKNVLKQKNQWKIQIFQQNQGFLKMKLAYFSWKFTYSKNTKILNTFYRVLYANILRSSFNLLKNAQNQDKIQKRKQCLLQKILIKRRICDMRTWINKWYVLSQKKKEIQLCQKNSNQNFQNQLAHERRITTIQRFLGSQTILKNMKIQKQYLLKLKDYVRESKINNNRIEICRKNIEKNNIKTFLQALRQNNLIKKQKKQNEYLINQKNNFKKLNYYFFQLKFLLQRNKRFANIMNNILSCNQMLSQKFCFKSIMQASHGKKLKKMDFKNRGLTQLVTSASQIILKWLSNSFANLKSFSDQQPYKKNLLKKLIQRKIQFIQRPYISKWRFKSNQMKQFQEDSEEGDSKLEQVFLSKRFDIILEFIASKGYDMSQLNTYVKQKKQREIDLMHKSATRLILNASEMNLLPKSFNTWLAFVQRRKSIKEACSKMLPRIRQPDLLQAFKKWKSETFIVYSKTQFDTRDVLLEKMVVFKENTDRLEKQLKEAENMLNEQTTLNTLLENKNVLAEKFAIRIISLFEKKVQKQGFDKWISFVKQQRQDEYEYIQLQSDDKVNELQLEIQRLNTLFMELQKQNEELRAISLESISVAESIQNIAKERDGTNDALKEKQISIQNLIEENNSLSVKLNLAQSQTAQIMRMSKLEKSSKNNFPQEASSTHTSYEQSL